MFIIRDSWEGACVTSGLWRRFSRDSTLDIPKPIKIHGFTDHTVQYHKHGKMADNNFVKQVQYLSSLIKMSDELEELDMCEYFYNM